MPKHVGIYNLFLDSATGGGGEKRTLVMAERLAPNYKVTLIVGEAPNVSDLERYFRVRLKGVTLVTLKLPLQIALRGLVNSKNGSLLRAARLDLALMELRRALERTYFRQIQSFGFDAFINSQGYSILPNPAPRGIYMCMFPHELKGDLRPDKDRGLLRELYVTLGNRVVGMTPAVLNSYNCITANSNYTSEWIRRLWQRESQVVYSACEDMGPPAAKEKIILHVGRMVGQSRNDYKHQRTLLDVFRRSQVLIENGWQLHFAGTLLPDTESAQALARLKQESAGLPVVFHPNARFGPLRDLYRRASIYWHATGYGSSPEQQPGKHEHFGMTTVEAMSAGAVPVVINSGGQRETVEHGVNGFAWNTLDELQSYTLQLAADPVLLKRFSDQAVSGSKRFNRTAFEDRIENLVDSLLLR